MPTGSIDVNAIRDIHQNVRELVAQGVAVISSYLPEIRSRCDSMAVCRQGRAVEKFDVRRAADKK